MRSLEIPLLLLRKELRELAASRAYWLLLLIIGPLVGHSFLTAVEAYAEASGNGTQPAALAQGLSPLDGIEVPTFGAYDLAVTLLFPFVAIRLVSSERDSGALKLMLQAPARIPTMLAAKGVALMLGWLIAWIPAMLALAVWRLHGGSMYPPEVANLLLGHLLRVFLSAGIAVAAASVARSGASAAIVTLAFTVGTWALDFVAAGRGGWLQDIAAYTPTAILRGFEQGLFRVDSTLICLTLGLAGFAIAAVWLSRHGAWSAAILALVALAIAGAPAIRTAWDFSENRRNSFSRADEAALRSIRNPLRIEVHLAPEDPRLTDLDGNIIAKLRRTLPSLQVDRISGTHAGLFEDRAQHYGEVWYEMDGRRLMSRSTTEPIVLETLYRLAQVPPPIQSQESSFAGHPLSAHPVETPWLFYAAWPLAVGLIFKLGVRR